MTIELRSPDFGDRSAIPERHGHDDENISPALEWVGIPPDATELLLMCEDPDAPHGSFLHWLLTGIDPHTAGVPEHGTPVGAKVWRNDFGESGWGGPAPPPGSGRHRYVLSLYALSQPGIYPRRPRSPMCTTRPAGSHSTAPP